MQSTIKESTYFFEKKNRENCFKMSNNVRIIKIDKDPDIERLANEARRLSMGGSHLMMMPGAGGGGDYRRGSSTIDNPGNTRRGSEKSFNIPITRVGQESVSPRMSRASSGGSHGSYGSYGGGDNGNSRYSHAPVGRRQSEQFNDKSNGVSSYGRASPLPSNRISASTRPPSFSRKQSEYLENSGRRGSYSDPTFSSMNKREPSLTRRGSAAGFERRDSGSNYNSLPRNARRGSNAGMSGTDSLPRRGSNANIDRRGSNANIDRRGSNANIDCRAAPNVCRASPGRRNSEDIDAAEMARRRLSEAGLRRPSATDIVLNENTDNLMVGQEVWVDGTKHGRIAFIGNVHFTKGEMAGIHLDTAIGKNNGTIGGILYFQTEPRHGVFSRLHRLALAPLPDPEYDDDQGSY